MHVTLKTSHLNAVTAAGLLGELVFAFCDEVIHQELPSTDASSLGGIDVSEGCSLGAYLGVGLVTTELLGGGGWEEGAGIKDIYWGDLQWKHVLSIPNRHSNIVKEQGFIYGLDRGKSMPRNDLEAQESKCCTLKLLLQY